MRFVSQRFLLADWPFGFTFGFIVLLISISLIHFQCFLQITLIDFQLGPCSANILTRTTRRGWLRPLNLLSLLHGQTPLFILPARHYSLDLPLYFVDDLIDLVVLQERQVVRAWEGSEGRDECFALAHEVQQLEVVQLVVAPCGIELRLAQQVQPLRQSDPYVSRLDIEVVALLDLCRHLHRGNGHACFQTALFLPVGPGRAVLGAGPEDRRFFSPALPVFLHGEYTLTIKLIYRLRNNQ